MCFPSRNEARWAKSSLSKAEIQEGAAYVSISSQWFTAPGQPPSKIWLVTVLYSDKTNPLSTKLPSVLMVLLCRRRYLCFLQDAIDISVVAALRDPSPARAGTKLLDSTSAFQPCRPAVCARPRVVRSGITEEYTSYCLTCYFVPFKLRSTRAHVDIQPTGDRPHESSKSRFAFGVAWRMFYDTGETNPISIVDSRRSRRSAKSATLPYLFAIGCRYCAMHYISFKTRRNLPFVTIPRSRSDAPLFIRTAFAALKNCCEQRRRSSVRNPSVLSHMPDSNVDASRRFGLQEMRP